VGTTTVRAPGSAVDKVGFSKNNKVFIKDCSEETSIFIYLGYKFKIINTLITNLHLSKSSPLIMASAFSSREIMLKAYKEVVEKNTDSFPMKIQCLSYSKYITPLSVVI
jgi:S-adenosylmethionine:tRNA ribosyltransferase-isomerase